jgi:hypothetical protein
LYVREELSPLPVTRVSRCAVADADATIGKRIGFGSVVPPYYNNARRYAYADSSTIYPKLDWQKSVDTPDSAKYNGYIPRINLKNNVPETLRVSGATPLS